MRRKVLRCSAVLVLAYAILCSLLAVFVAEGALHPHRRPLLSSQEIQARNVASNHHAELVNVQIAADDGALLRAWSLRPQQGSGTVVLLLHGLSDNRTGMMSYAELFLQHGFGVLMPDARAHGESGGQLATYGLFEATDIHQWVNWLVREQHPECIFGFAESMGAAQLLQSLSMEQRFCAVAAESPFSGFREIAYDRFGQFFGVGPWVGRYLLRPAIEGAFAYTKWKYGLDLTQVSPEATAANSHVPILLVHGSIDRNIPIRHSWRIVKRNRGIELWEVAKADHCGAISVAREEFERRVVRFFAAHNQPGLPISPSTRTSPSGEVRFRSCAGTRRSGRSGRRCATRRPPRSPSACWDRRRDLPRA